LRTFLDNTPISGNNVEFAVIPACGFRLEDLFEKSDMKMETWDLKVAKS
jgi:hypothetical protein